MSSRAHIRLKTKLCSALCQMLREEDGKLVPIIPHKRAKELTEDQVLAIFDWHHDPIPKAHDGPDVHWNLTPIEKAPHRKRTAEIDVPMIAKGKRIQRKQAEHKSRLAGNPPQPTKQKRAWPSRPLQSRNSFQRRRA